MGVTDRRTPCSGVDPAQEGGLLLRHGLAGGGQLPALRRLRHKLQRVGRGHTGLPCRGVACSDVGMSFVTCNDLCGDVMCCDIW